MMMLKGLLPIGSVVTVGDSTKKVMIVGVCQKGGAEGKMWDYTGVLFPEGFLDAKKMFLFNNTQITMIHALGYQDAEQLAFKERADRLIQELRK
jgi:hypothetical protein